MNLNLLALETSSSRCGVALLRETAAGSVVTVLEHEGTQEHAERLLPMADELLKAAGLTPADLHAVAFGQGPGGFTGLRVACGVAQGMGLALDIPVVPVVSHLAVAEAAGAQAGDIVLVALDARMNEVYLAAYLRSADPEHAWITLQSPMLIAAEEVVPWSLHYLSVWSEQSQEEGLAHDLTYGLVDGLTGGLVGGCASPSSGPTLHAAGDAWHVYSDRMAVPSDWRLSVAARPQATSVAQLAREAWLRGEAQPPELAAPLYVRDKVAFTTAERERGLGGNPKAAPALSAPVLEPMTEADVDAVADIEANLQAFPWTRGNFADALASGYEACVLRQGGKVVGFCLVMLAPDVAHLLVIGVARTQHRQGYGSLLMRWCEGIAREQGLPAVMLEVRPSNVPALAFYEKIGFQRIGVRRGYYPNGQGAREDAWVMQKTLDGAGAPL
ncbi:tRNA (adenosine(37)-N6)-threonylcarbamoyltransferase complex dimerization subunit type 1 TsaB [Bordetella sp. 15P40C-2]|uniref:tRNA (adenosine(37)-N6)-threonylcarbamoyltransferase complex dimerization subunit type 1 TsaB n=1 Tax=Bordetella sp. 15P40C-2 TaxID=2572246 RepID=UPI001327CCA4|nr:tRNA (adenosine(37)-N6)-threonylcarbamoyltransferase complex dimerization subunit type 1 TsaB [Bordetella sp. 15P40C-2]MVW72465.1 tRNA (adenosine(37)-N6)-threonylcarbamoyltransferase complex dimerization subunit type 1 TsaB [Bordetella sp. 15P40C-2]